MDSYEKQMRRYNMINWLLIALALLMPIGFILLMNCILGGLIWNYNGIVF